MEEYAQVLFKFYSFSKHQMNATAVELVTVLGQSACSFGEAQDAVYSQ